MRRAIELLNPQPFDVRTLEDEVHEVVASMHHTRPPPIPFAPSPPTPDYVEHLDGVSKVGELSAAAVATDFEAAASNIERMGKELIEVAKRCETLVKDVMDVVRVANETAEYYRNEGKKAFQQIEQAAIITNQVRKTCNDMRAQLDKTMKGEGELAPG